MLDSTRPGIGCMILPKIDTADLPEEYRGAIRLFRVERHARDIHAQNRANPELDELSSRYVFDDDEGAVHTAATECHERVVDVLLDRPIERLLGRPPKLSSSGLLGTLLGKRIKGPPSAAADCSGLVAGCRAKTVRVPFDGIKQKMGRLLLPGQLEACVLD